MDAGHVSTVSIDRRCMVSRMADYLSRIAYNVQTSTSKMQEKLLIHNNANKQDKNQQIGYAHDEIGIIREGAGVKTNRYGMIKSLDTGY